MGVGLSSDRGVFGTLPGIKDGVFCKIVSASKWGTVLAKKPLQKLCS